MKEFRFKKIDAFATEKSDGNPAGYIWLNSHSDLYKHLDVSTVDHLLLERLLGLSQDREETCLAYSNDSLDAVGRVIEHEYQLAFIFRPMGVELVKAVADAGEKMPRKSTYFFPKVPAGLVFQKLV